MPRAKGITRRREKTQEQESRPEGVGPSGSSRESAKSPSELRVPGARRCSSMEAREWRERAEKAEQLSTEVVDAALHVYLGLGPGLLESVYETVLARELETRGLLVERQRRISFDYAGIRFHEGLRVDLLINRVLVVEVKSVEVLLPIHRKQVLSYLRLLNLTLGLLVNFGARSFRDGCKRVVNNHPLNRY